MGKSEGESQEVILDTAGVGQTDGLRRRKKMQSVSNG